MIPVDRPYERVKDLARKDKSGYTDPDEYNRNLRDVQHQLMSYYISMLETGQPFPENLNPFLKRAEASVSTGIVTRPDDMRYVLEVYCGYLETIDCKTTVVYYPAADVKAGELGDVLSSAIRKPSLSKPVFYFEGGTIRVEPKDFTHAVVRYVKMPPDAIYGYTVDEDNDRIVFSSGTSTNLIWLPQDEHNIVDLLLFMKGLETRDTALIQWVSGKRQLTGGIN